MKTFVLFVFWGTGNKQQQTSEYCSRSTEQAAPLYHSHSWGQATSSNLEQVNTQSQGAGRNLQRGLVLRPQHQSSAASPAWPSCQCPGTGRSSLGPAFRQSAAPLLAGTHAHQAEPPAGVGDPPCPAPHTHTHLMLFAACSIWAPMLCKRFIFTMPSVLNMFLARHIINRCLCIWHK